MRKPSRKSRPIEPDDEEDEPVDRKMPHIFVLQALGWSHRDAVGCVVAGAAAIMILVNVLFLQSGPHPAPIFKTGIMQTASIPDGQTSAGAAPVLPRARPTDRSAPAQPSTGIAPPARPATEVVTDIQRELARRGFYDGPTDGRYGPKTDAAIRDFEHAAGLSPSTDPDEALLRAIRASNAKGRHPAGRSAIPAHDDPIAALLVSNRASSDRVRSVQRALTDYGYGQIEPTGIVDSDTRSAIAKFERSRNLPVTGQVSDRIMRELASTTGRPLE